MWSKTGLWRAVERIRGATLKVDIDGIAAKRFGTATSGHVIVYDPSGRLVFEGGITAGRGHQGDNTGHKAITDIVEGRIPIVTHMPVFGCAIFE
jgi:hypothetical protein